MFRRKQPERVRSIPTPVPVEHRRAVTMVTPELLAKPAANTVPTPKAAPHRSQSLRDSANGEECLIRLPGCPCDTAMTIWSHYRGSAGGKGGARKSDDICGAYGCTYCDAVYDGQRPRPAGMSKEDVDLAWLEGHIRSLVRLQQKALLK